MPVGNATVVVGVGCATDGVVIPLEAVKEPEVVMPPGTVMPPGKDTAPPLAPVIEPSDAMVNVTPFSSLTSKIIVIYIRRSCKCKTWSACSCRAEGRQAKDITLDSHGV